MCLGLAVSFLSADDAALPPIESLLLVTICGTLVVILIYLWCRFVRWLNSRQGKISVKEFTDKLAAEWQQCVLHSEPSPPPHDQSLLLFPCSPPPPLHGRAPASFQLPRRYSRTSVGKQLGERLERFSRSLAPDEVVESDERCSADPEAARASRASRLESELALRAAAAKEGLQAWELEERQMKRSSRGSRGSRGSRVSAAAAGRCSALAWPFSRASAAEPKSERASEAPAEAVLEAGGAPTQLTEPIASGDETDALDGEACAPAPSAADDKTGALRPGKRPAFRPAAHAGSHRGSVYDADEAEEKERPGRLITRRAASVKAAREQKLSERLGRRDKPAAGGLADAAKAKLAVSRSRQKIFIQTGGSKAELLTMHWADLDLDTFLGNGGTGSLYAGHYHERPVAVRRLGATALTRNLSPDTLRSEVEALGSLRHPNLVRLLAVVSGQSFLSTAVVLELAPFSLYGAMRRQVDPSSWADPLLRMLREVAWGLAFLHEAGFAHGRLHPCNVLLTAKLMVKLTDYSRHFGAEPPPAPPDRVVAASSDGAAGGSQRHSFGSSTSQHHSNSSFGSSSCRSFHSDGSFRSDDLEEARLERSERISRDSVAEHAITDEVARWAYVAPEMNESGGSLLRELAAGSAAMSASLPHAGGKAAAKKATSAKGVWQTTAKTVREAKAAKEAESRAAAACDIWSFGCLIAFAGTGEAPYSSEVAEEVAKREQTPSQITADARLAGTSPLHRLKCLEQPACPESVYALASRCVRILPSHRPTSSVIVSEMRKGPMAALNKAAISRRDDASEDESGPDASSLHSEEGEQHGAPSADARHSYTAKPFCSHGHALPAAARLPAPFNLVSQAAESAAQRQEQRDLKQRHAAEQQLQRLASVGQGLALNDRKKACRRVAI